MMASHRNLERRKPIMDASASAYSRELVADAARRIRRDVATVESFFGDAIEREGAVSWSRALMQMLSGGEPGQQLHVPWEMLMTRDLGAASDAAGGYLVGATVASPVDILRPFSTVLRAGVTALPGLSADTPLPRTSGTSTVSWMSSETASASPSTPTLASTTMVPKIGIGVIQASRHFMKQANDVGGWLQRELRRTAASVVDQAVLNGVGTAGEPRGIMNTTGVGTQTGTSLAWTGLLSMKAKAATVNVQDGTIAFIGTPAVRELLEGRTKETGGGRYIWEDDEVASCPGYASTLMPTGTLLSGPFSMCYLGLWGSGITVETTGYASAALFQAGIIQARVIVSCDVALGCDPAAFTKATSVT
jgi:HK97 family phage major capsid protein